MNPEKFKENLLENGYKKFKPHLKDSFTESYQKCIRDDIGKKYFINFYYHPDQLFRNNQVWKSRLELEIQFNKVYKKKEYTYNLTMFSMYKVNKEKIHIMHPLNEIEELVEDMFKKQKFEYYEQ